MPTYKNSFQSPDFIEEVILGNDNKKLGTIRIKPSSIQWKPANKQQFTSVSLDKFLEWIQSDETKTKQTKY